MTNTFGKSIYFELTEKHRESQKFQIMMIEINVIIFYARIIT